MSAARPFTGPPLLHACTTATSFDRSCATSKAPHAVSYLRLCSSSSRPSLQAQGIQHAAGAGCVHTHTRFTWVRCPIEKSNTSSDSSLRMIMLFSQRVSLVLLAPTRSGMKLGHLLGHSCFKTCTGATSPQTALRHRTPFSGWHQCGRDIRTMQHPVMWADGMAGHDQINCKDSIQTWASNSGDSCSQD